MAIDVEHLSETDLELVGALQLNPLASWSTIGKILQRNPITLARHYRNLVDAGLAWTTAYPAPSVWNANCLAYIEIDCEAVQLGTVAETISHDTQAFTVEIMSGGADLFVTASFRNLADLSVYVRNRLGRVPGVRHTRARLATRMFSEGSQWRVRSLEQSQVEALRPSPHRPETSINVLDSDDRRILTELSFDARADASTLAERLSLSETNIRRRLKSLVATDAVRIRCDVAHQFVGWPISATYWAIVSAANIDEVGRAIGAMREIRLCVALTGARNLLFTAWLRSLSDSLRLEKVLVERIPTLQIQDRSVQIHPVKRMGRLLNGTGRAVGVVPMNPWQDPEVATRSTSGGMFSQSEIAQGNGAIESELGFA